MNLYSSVASSERSTGASRAPEMSGSRTQVNQCYSGSGFWASGATEIVAAPVSRGATKKKTFAEQLLLSSLLQWGLQRKGS